MEPLSRDNSDAALEPLEAGVLGPCHLNNFRGMQDFTYGEQLATPQTTNVSVVTIFDMAENSDALCSLEDVS